MGCTRACPTSPTRSTAIVIGSDVALGWDEPPGAGSQCGSNSYLVQVGSSPGASDLAQASTPGLIGAFSVSGAPAGTFYIRVRSQGPGGLSAPSNEVVVTVPGVTPPDRVWEGIRSRLRLPGATSTETAPPSRSWWTSVGLWRGLATVGFALAFALAITLLTPRAPSDSIVVVLAAQDNKPALVATAERNARYLTIKPVAPIAIAADRALELWLLPPGANPRSMGLISATGIARVPLWLSSTLTLLIPVLASVAAWIWLDEPLTAVQLIAMVVVVGALAIIVTARGQARSLTMSIRPELRTRAIS